jgi:microcystin-dependent protein
MPEDIFGHVPAPSGTIAYWNDDPANLPPGWVVCDGNNGTPNLLDRFAKSVSSAGTNPGNTGGQHSYSMSVPQLPPHTHSFDGTGTTGSHNHDIYVADDMAYNSTGFGYEWAEDNGDRGGDSTDTSGAHSHTVSFDSFGSGASVDNRPPYMELVPVMKT